MTDSHEMTSGNEGTEEIIYRISHSELLYAKVNIRTQKRREGLLALLDALPDGPIRLIHERVSELDMHDEAGAITAEAWRWRAELNAD